MLEVNDFVFLDVFPLWHVWAVCLCGIYCHATHKNNIELLVGNGGWGSSNKNFLKYASSNYVACHG